MKFSDQLFEVNGNKFIVPANGDSTTVTIWYGSYDPHHRFLVLSRFICFMILFPHHLKVPWPSGCTDPFDFLASFAPKLEPHTDSWCFDMISMLLVTIILFVGLQANVFFFSLLMLEQQFLISVCYHVLWHLADSRDNICGTLHRGIAFWDYIGLVMSRFKIHVQNHHDKNQPKHIVSSQGHELKGVNMCYCNCSHIQIYPNLNIPWFCFNMSPLGLSFLHPNFRIFQGPFNTSNKNVTFNVKKNTDVGVALLGQQFFHLGRGKGRRTFKWLVCLGCFVKWTSILNDYRSHDIVSLIRIFVKNEVLKHLVADGSSSVLPMFLDSSVYDTRRLQTPRARRNFGWLDLADVEVEDPQLSHVFSWSM